MKDLNDLLIYNRAIELRKKIWQLVKSFPKEEKFRLTDQLIRSTRKCPANIAEGHGRYHWQENIQYCRIARGSLTETLDHLTVAVECDYIQEELKNEINKEVVILIKMINKFIAYLNSMKNQ